MTIKENDFFFTMKRFERDEEQSSNFFKSFDLKSLLEEREKEEKEKKYNEGLEKLRENNENIKKDLDKMSSNIQEKKEVVEKKPIKDIKPKIKILPQEMKKFVFGQDLVIDDVCDILKVSALGISINSKKPLGCFFFAGPSGVGKTELANQLAKFLDVQMLRLDMSEYTTEPDIKKLIGTAPGYVGYENGGILTNFVMENPQSLVLFDEIEKAHPDINKILLQLMDNGEVTDNKGNKADFKNVIFIATSNLGAELEYLTEITKEHKESLRMEVIRNKIPPEIINRYDSIFQFNSITKEMYGKVVEKFLNIFKNNFKEQQKIDLEFGSTVNDFVVESSFDVAMGGRPARRFIEKVIVKGLVEAFYMDNDVITKQELIKIDFLENKIILKDKEDKVIFEVLNTLELVERAKKTHTGSKNNEIKDVSE